MAKIVRYIALNHARRDRRQPSAVDPAAIDEALAGRFSDDDRAAHVMDDQGRLDEEHAPFDDRMMRALGSIGATARACLLLRTIEELNYDEIAKLLEIPPGTAMSHVHRTRMLLRQRLADLDPTARRGGGAEGQEDV
jgi:RNA polymerase sigma-70 factor (ECF subfamily)